MYFFQTTEYIYSASIYWVSPMGQIQLQWLPSSQGDNRHHTTKERISPQVVMGTRKKNKAAEGDQEWRRQCAILYRGLKRFLQRWLWRAWVPSAPVPIFSKLWQPIFDLPPLSVPAQSKPWQFGPFCQILNWLRDQGSVQPKFSRAESEVDCVGSSPVPFATKHRP